MSIPQVNSAHPNQIIKGPAGKIISMAKNTALSAFGLYSISWLNKFTEERSNRLAAIDEIVKHELWVNLDGEIFANNEIFNADGERVARSYTTLLKKINTTEMGINNVGQHMGYFKMPGWLHLNQDALDLLPHLVKALQICREKEKSEQYRCMEPFVQAHKVWKKTELEKYRADLKNKPSKESGKEAQKPANGFSLECVRFFQQIYGLSDTHSWYEFRKRFPSSGDSYYHDKDAEMQERNFDTLFKYYLSMKLSGCDWEAMKKNPPRRDDRDFWAREPNYEGLEAFEKKLKEVKQLSDKYL